MSIDFENFESTMTGELDKAIVQKPVTGFLADNNLRAKFVGGKTVLIPEMSFSGLGDYNRDTGFVNGTVSVTAEPYTLTMDRGRSFQLDREDNDETGVADLAGQVMGEFVRTQVVPEIDAYVLSKLGGYAAAQSQTVTGIIEGNSFNMLKEGISKVQNEVGYDEELVAFVDSNVWASLQSCDNIAHMLMVNDFKKGDMHTEVHYLNGVAILPIPDSRMKTAYTFNDGVSAGQEDGGFIPQESASKIGFLVMPKRAASLVKKTEKVRAFDPDHNLNADAWKFDYRVYYDLFIRNSMEKAIYAFVY